MTCLRQADLSEQQPPALCPLLPSKAPRTGCAINSWLQSSLRQRCGCSGYVLLPRSFFLQLQQALCSDLSVLLKQGHVCRSSSPCQYS